MTILVKVYIKTTFFNDVNYFIDFIPRTTTDKHSFPMTIHIKFDNAYNVLYLQLKELCLSITVNVRHFFL